MKIPYNILIQIKMSVRPYFKGFTLIFFFYNCRKQDFTLFPPALQSAPNRNPQILFARPSLSDKCAAGHRQRTCVLIISEIHRSDLPSLVIHESSICEAFRDFAAALKEEQDVCSESETKAYVARKQKELSERLTAKDAFDQ